MTSYSHAFDWARRHVDAGTLPGAVLGVATSEGVVALDAFGDAETGDHYPLFSITKPLVGLAALRLVEQGRLTLETPLTDAVPEFGADRADVVRLRHLVSHTAGIPEPALDVPGGLRPALLAPGRDFAAGAISRYSTIAYEGIAALIAHAGGAPWEQQVLETLAAADATGVTFDVASTRHAPIECAEQGVDWELFASHRNPGAGAFARAEDLLAVAVSLLRDDGRLVHPLTGAMMRRSLTDDVPTIDPYPPERGTHWGFTWCLRDAAPAALARDAFGHGGWAGTDFWLHPEHDVAFVLLTNVASSGRLGLSLDELDNAVVTAR